MRTQSNSKFEKCFAPSKVRNTSQYQPKISYEELLRKTKTFLGNKEAGTRSKRKGEEELNSYGNYSYKKGRRSKKVSYLKMDLKNLIKIVDPKGI